MNLFILGVFGPFQLLFLLIIVGLVIVVPVVLLVSRSKHKARANTLDDVLSRKATTSDDRMEKLERLNKLRTAGALSEDEFEKEKKRILGS
jgi:uncharacterized membrane protein